MFKKHTAISVLAAIAIAAAGCGDDGGSDTLAKADLAKKADGICASFNPKVKELGEPNVEDPAELEKFERTFDGYVTDMRKQLGELKPADDVKGEWDGALAKFDKTAEATTAFFTAVKAEDVEAVGAAGQQVETLGNESDKAFDALGASACGSKSS